MTCSGSRTDERGALGTTGCGCRQEAATAGAALSQQPPRCAATSRWWECTVAGSSASVHPFFSSQTAAGGAAGIQLLLRSAPAWQWPTRTQDRLDGQRSTKKRKGLVDRLRRSWDRDSAPVFFIGQRVYARWTSERGTLVHAVNRTAEDERGFDGTIAAEGEAPGFWRVGFDGEPDHPGIPAKYITPREDVSDEEGEGL